MLQVLTGIISSIDALMLDLFISL